MAVVIRLRRAGSKKRPFYHMVVADSRMRRDGRFIEKVGHYNPLPRQEEIVFDEERVRHWIDQGAKPSTTVERLMKRQQRGVVGPSTKERKRALAAAAKATEEAEKQKAAAEEAEKKRAAEEAEQAKQAAAAAEEAEQAKQAAAAAEEAEQAKQAAAPAEEAEQQAAPESAAGEAVETAGDDQPVAGTGDGEAEAATEAAKTEEG